MSKKKKRKDWKKGPKIHITYNWWLKESWAGATMCGRLGSRRMSFATFLLLNYAGLCTTFALPICKRCEKIADKHREKQEKLAMEFREEASKNMRDDVIKKDPLGMSSMAESSHRIDSKPEPEQRRPRQPLSKNRRFQRKLTRLTEEDIKKACKALGIEL
jgi:hypothetical protein